MFSHQKFWSSLKIGAIATSALTLGIFVAVPNFPAIAYEVGNGQTVFLKAPRLIRAAATQVSPYSPSTYQFTIHVPKNAGEPLKAVTIAQKTSPERIQFDTNKSKAFIGDSFAGGSPIDLADIGGSQSDDNSVTIVFDRPVEPGNTVTVSLRALHNPQFGGVYQFGVTAYPIGENSEGLYLGSARLHFLQK